MQDGLAARRQVVDHGRRCQLLVRLGFDLVGAQRPGAQGPQGQGLNVDTNEVEDLVKAGIMDPTMVTRSALQNAASIAKNILMTAAIVAEPPERAGAVSMPGGMVTWAD